MFKSTALITAFSSLLITWASLAHGEQMAAHCHRHVNVIDCNDDRSGECFWNYADGRCQYRRNAPSHCLRMTYDECRRNFDVCRWNDSERQCQGRI